MDVLETGQVTSSAAEIYEEFYVPAIFDQWPEIIIDRAGLKAGQEVLDVACGTGILARQIASFSGEPERVVGLDINGGMLAVARSKNPNIDWREGAAETLPFGDNSFDRVVSQFGMMFFEDRRQAVSEMVRVLKPGGRLAVAVWDSLEETPAYNGMANLLDRLFGKDAAAGLRSPYNLGDVTLFSSYFEDQGLFDVSVETIPGTGRFASLEKWVYTDVKGWVMSELIDDQAMDQLLSAARDELHQFELADGKIQFDTPIHLLTGRKR